MFAIACGYEDVDDCDALRTDPLFKLAVGQAPESGRPLCSQPTMSRLENAPSRLEVARITAALVDIFCRSFPIPPAAITLDIDDTCDPVHGQQQLSLFNAHGAGDAIVVQASCRTNDPRVIALWQDDGSPMRFRALDELLDDVHGRLPFAPALTIAAKDGDAIRADAQNPSWGGPYPHEGGADDAERVFDPTPLQDLHEGFFKRHSHGDTSLSVSFARRGDTSRRMPSPHRPAVGSTMVSVSGRAASPLAVPIRYIPLMYSLKKPLVGRESEPPSPAL